MGKRSNFKRRPQDAYDTPDKAVIPLLHHLPDKTRFCEPCAGNGSLINTLRKYGHICTHAWDIKPRNKEIEKRDALDLYPAGVDYYITNPPWTRDILHRLIIGLSDFRLTWLLFDADWLFTKQSIPYMDRLIAVQPIGRVKWIRNSPSVGKDNSAWYLFSIPEKNRVTRFYPCLDK